MTKSTRASFTPIVLLALSVLSACAAAPRYTAPSPEIVTAFETASALDTVDAYETFLQSYPSKNWYDNQFESKAISRIRSLRSEQRNRADDEAWNTAAKDDTIASYQAYLDAGHRRHVDAAERGLTRRTWRNAAARSRASLLVTEDYENAPANFAIPEFQQAAEELFEVAGIEIVDAADRSFDLIVHQLEIAGVAWPEYWYPPAKDDGTPTEPIKLYTGYRIDITLVTSLGDLQVTRKASIPASAGYFSGGHQEQVSASNIELYSAPSGIFRSNIRSHARDSVIARKIASLLTGQLVSIQGCEAALQMGNSRQIDSFRGRGQRLLPDEDWREGVFAVLPAECRHSLDLWGRAQIVEQSVRQHTSSNPNGLCACPYPHGYLAEQPGCQSIKRSAHRSLSDFPSRFCYALDVPRDLLLAAKSDPATARDLPAALDEICGWQERRWGGTAPVCRAFSRYSFDPEILPDQAGVYHLARPNASDYDDIVTRASYRIGDLKPFAQQCHETRRGKSELLAETQGDIVFYTDAKQPDYVDKHCRFVDGDRLRP